jgi:alanyl aminopeptidase
VLLADDTAALAEEGSVPLGDALALQPAFLADPELPVFRRGLALFFLLHRAQLDDKGRAAFDRAVKKLVGPRAATLGLVARADEDPELPVTREATFTLLGRVAGDAKLVKEARAAVERWLGDRKSLSPDLVDVLLQIAAGDGDAAWFERILAEARRARDLHERGQLLRALGAFRDPALAERALGLVRGHEFDLRESIDILYLQFSDRVTRPAAWRGLKANWDGIVSRMRDDESLWLIRFIAGSSCDGAERDDLARFLGERAKSRMGAPQALRTGLDRADACIAAVARNGGAVSEFLSRF